MAATRGADEYSTTDYEPAARKRLGVAVRSAREADGYKSRPKFVATYGTHTPYGINKKSLELLERGQPGVGGPILRAVGRALIGWTEDTPRDILEGGPIPEPVSAEPVLRRPLTDLERQIFALYLEQLRERIPEPEAMRRVQEIARILEQDAALIAELIRREIALAEGSIPLTPDSASGV